MERAGQANAKTRSKKGREKERNDPMPRIISKSHRSSTIRKVQASHMTSQISLDKIKVLCLHGSEQTGEIFRSKLGNLIQKGKKPNIIFTFLDAPHELPLRAGDELPLRSWYFRSNGVITDVSLSSALSVIDCEWNKTGGFDGSYCIMFCNTKMISYL